MHYFTILQIFKRIILRIYHYKIKTLFAYHAGIVPSWLRRIIVSLCNRGQKNAVLVLKCRANY